MFIRSSVVFITIILASFSCYADVADIADPATDLQGQDFDDFRHNEKLQLCNTKYCIALRHIGDAWSALAHRDRPNTMAQLHPRQDYFEVADRKAFAAIRSRGQSLEDCHAARKIIFETTIRFNDRLGFSELMEIVHLLPEGAQRCRQAIIAAMPPTPASAELLHQADDLLQRDAGTDLALRRRLH